MPEPLFLVHRYEVTVSAVVPDVARVSVDAERPGDLAVPLGVKGVIAVEGVGLFLGEFNSGKSAFINALLGAPVAMEGVTPTTDRITILRHGEETGERERRNGVLERTYPSEFLEEVAIVDTPGTNAILRHHEELSRGFVPRSDLVLFVTSVDRPFTQSEREYLELIRDWGKKIVVVVNKADLLSTAEEAAKVHGFVEEGIRSLLKMAPPVFLVSSRLAQRAKSDPGAHERDVLMRSRFR